MWSLQKKIRLQLPLVLPCCQHTQGMIKLVLYVTVQVEENIMYLQYYSLFCMCTYANVIWVKSKHQDFQLKLSVSVDQLLFFPKQTAISCTFGVSLDTVIYFPSVNVSCLPSFLYVCACDKFLDKQCYTLEACCCSSNIVLAET